MSIPGVFKPHHLHIKDENGNRIGMDKSGEFIDGGALYNYPIDAFDYLKYQKSSISEVEKEYIEINKKTLGLSLFTPSMQSDLTNSADNIVGFLQTLMILFYNAENLFYNLNPYNEYRTIKINDDNLSTLDFNLSEKEKQTLISNGILAVNRFYKKQQTEIKDLEIEAILEKLIDFEN
jgi:predicted acylesterase/phospholipase RssA